MRTRLANIQLILFTEITEGGSEVDMWEYMELKKVFLPWVDKWIEQQAFMYWTKTIQSQLAINLVFLLCYTMGYLVPVWVGFLCGGGATTAPLISFEVDGDTVEILLL